MGTENSKNLQKLKYCRSYFYFPRVYLQNIESAFYYKGVLSKLELDFFSQKANQAQNFQYNFFYWYQSDNKRYSPKFSFKIQTVDKKCLLFYDVPV